MLRCVYQLSKLQGCETEPTKGLLGFYLMRYVTPGIYFTFEDIDNLVDTTEVNTKTFFFPNNFLSFIIQYLITIYRVRNLKFARNLKFTTSKTLVNFMKKMMSLSKNWYFSVQKALIYYTVNKSHHNYFILLIFSHVANFRYVANFRFLTLYI